MYLRGDQPRKKPSDRRYDSQNQVRVASQIPKTVRREYHGLASSQLAQAIKQVSGVCQCTAHENAKLHTPCSAAGSSDALGSSNSSSATLASSRTTDRMKVLALWRRVSVWETHEISVGQESSHC